MKTLIMIVLLILGLVIGVTRAQFVDAMVKFYESQGGEIQIKNCPFTDIDGSKYQESIIKAYSLEITAGTSKTTFAPDEKMKPYQAFLFIGRTLYALER